MSDETVRTAASYQVLTHYLRSEQRGRVQAEYIWIGGSGEDLRCKSRTLEGWDETKTVADLPSWNFDGSSTGQAPGSDSEVIIKPRAIFKDPFRGEPNILVLCDCWDPHDRPIPSNTRYPASLIFEKAKNEHSWFGLEQEYTLFTKDKWPLGWPKNGYPGPQGPYYCAVGADHSYGRDLVEAHYKACLYAGVTISGINGEVMPGQWEYQVGPCEGIDAGDHLWIARYLMHRLGEQFGIIVSFDPKPIPGDWNGAGCHTNVSTQAMRDPGGFEVIKKALAKLEKRHEEHIAVYGQGNERRLTGAHETAPIDRFSWGVANRGCSVRVPRQTERENRGYFEDRRPASNMDPYVVTSKIIKTICLDS